MPSMDATYNGDTLEMDIIGDRVSIGICDHGKEAHTALTVDESAIIGAHLLRPRLEKVEKMLADSLEGAHYKPVAEALSEVRSMLKGTT